MIPARPFSELEVVGIADTLGRAVHPRLLPPVFRTLDGATVLYPPYSFVPGGVVPSMQCAADDFSERVRLDKMMRLPAPLLPTLPAKERWLLWVDEHHKVRYEPSLTVQTAFDQRFEEHMGHAWAAIAQLPPDLATAYRHAGIAHSFQPSHLDPLILKAAIQQYRGQELLLNDTRTLVRHLSLSDFDQLVAEHVKDFHRAEALVKAQPAPEAFTQPAAYKKAVATYGGVRVRNYVIAKVLPEIASRGPEPCLALLRASTAAGAPLDEKEDDNLRRATDLHEICLLRDRLERDELAGALRVALSETPEKSRLEDAKGLDVLLKACRADRRRRDWTEMAWYRGLLEIMRLLWLMISGSSAPALRAQPS